MKIDLLAIAAHPDDVELACSGTLIKHIQQGKTAGILDLTRGELGTRGSAEIRKSEAEAAAKILGVSFRDNLGFKDGFFADDEEHQLSIIEKIRLYQPEIVLANAIDDRHPDHGRASDLIEHACFYSGLSKIETFHNGEQQEKWRPRAIYHYIQDYHIQPDVIVDVTDQFDTKIKSIQAFSSQFYNPESKEPESPISSKDFFEFVVARMREYGRLINVTYAEGFTRRTPVGTDNLFDLR